MLEKYSTLVGLGFGLLLSLLLTVAGFTTSLLANKGIWAPASQCVLNYVLLALVYGSIMLHRRQPPKGALYIYIILGFIDVEAKYFVITGYNYSSRRLTSIMLLDCWTIPCVLFLSWLVFKAKYELQKLVGALTCLVGLIILFYSDVYYNSAPHTISSGGNPLKGDLLVIFGATFYALCNVGEVYFVGNADRVELMAFLGISGVLYNVHKIIEHERDEVKLIISSPGMIFLVIGFSLATFLFYSGVPLLHKISGSRIINLLTLLTSNIWAVLIQVFVFHEKIEWMYFAALAAVTLGLIIYLWKEEADSGDSKIADFSNKEGCRISFEGARNSLCYISMQDYISRRATLVLCYINA